MGCVFFELNQNQYLRFESKLLLPVNTRIAPAIIPPVQNTPPLGLLSASIYEMKSMWNMTTPITILITPIHQVRVITRPGQLHTQPERASMACPPTALSVCEEEFRNWLKDRMILRAKLHSLRPDNLESIAPMPSR